MRSGGGEGQRLAQTPVTSCQREVSLVKLAVPRYPLKGDIAVFGVIGGVIGLPFKAAGRLYDAMDRKTAGRDDMARAYLAVAVVYAPEFVVLRIVLQLSLRQSPFTNRATVPRAASSDHGKTLQTTCRTAILPSMS